MNLLLYSISFWCFKKIFT